MTGTTRSGTPAAADTALPYPAAAQLGVPHYPLLSPQEQELAALVYDKVAMTGRELERAFADTMPAAAVQAALGELAAKQVLRATEGKDGTIFYVQALRRTEDQERALTRLIDEQFDGDVAAAARLLMLLVHRRRPEMLGELSFCLAPPAASD